MKRDVRRRAKDRDGDTSQPGCRRVELEKKMGELGLGERGAAKDEKEAAGGGGANGEDEATVEVVMAIVFS
ncbi:hypothetical protein AMTR_s00167p00066530 [Amborella trichopoda]|uniref:Uncharacterized protein n=1 Tax=Amborella trichopoda TaxID=13333 RepID=W1PSR5_AMBTC|nr:hypothetical protein AMTR_s00167p00066530 [Amborella trichopoda]